MPTGTRHRQVNYLENIIKSDHGKLKQLIRPVRGLCIRPGPVRITVCPDYSMSAADRLNLTELATAVYPPDCAQERVGEWISVGTQNHPHIVRNERGLLTCHVGGLLRTMLLDYRLVKIGGIGDMMTAPLARRQGHTERP